MTYQLLSLITRFTCPWCGEVHDVPEGESAPFVGCPDPECPNFERGDEMATQMILVLDKNVYSNKNSRSPNSPISFGFCLKCHKKFVVKEKYRALLDSVVPCKGCNEPVFIPALNCTDKSAGIGDFTFQQLEEMQTNFIQRGAVPYPELPKAGEEKKDWLAFFDESDAVHIEDNNVMDFPVGALYSGGIADFKLQGGVFALTGKFRNIPRKEVESFISMHGGKVVHSVTKSTDYVVVGDEGSEQYSAEGAGGKITAALTLIANGGKVRIIQEMPFLIIMEKRKDG